MDAVLHRSKQLLKILHSTSAKRGLPAAGGLPIKWSTSAKRGLNYQFSIINYKSAFS